MSDDYTNSPVNQGEQEYAYTGLDQGYVVVDDTPPTGARPELVDDAQILWSLPEEDLPDPDPFRKIVMTMSEQQKNGPIVTEPTDFNEQCGVESKVVVMDEPITLTIDGTTAQEIADKQCVYCNQYGLDIQHAKSAPKANLRPYALDAVAQMFQGVGPSPMAIEKSLIAVLEFLEYGE